MRPEKHRTPALVEAGARQEAHGAGKLETEDTSDVGQAPGMQVQLALGPTGMARRGDPETSVEAAQAVNYTAGCRTVYKALVAMGGKGTAEAIAGRIGFDVMLPNTVSRRLLDLEKLALVDRLEPVQGTRGRSVYAWRVRGGAVTTQVVTAPGVTPVTPDAGAHHG